ncbi:hypothetical protein CDL12_02591 [Handroanthus impetiginosus]|uniref:Uncharacterized protein n=1 Tax=Handroanthus impetiginosus TaxID=429701 RepID=A0A2G9I4K9_9LAMI|nr:hypothetical protein CDL12_02591 [Handroanthus impetiginosus]
MQHMISRVITERLCPKCRYLLRRRHWKEEENKDGKNRDEKERKDEEKDQKNEKMDKERKDEEDEEEKKEKKEENEKKNEEDEEKEKKIEEKNDDKNGKKKDGEENRTKHYVDQVSCHHKVEMKKLKVISRKLDFGKDVNFGKRDYKAVRPSLMVYRIEMIGYENENQTTLIAFRVPLPPNMPNKIT